MDRVKALEVYVTVSAAGITYYPKDGFPKWENFPYVEIAELHGRTWESLGASEGWKADPYGVPAEPEHVTFVAQGPDASVAIEVIKGVLSKPPPPSKLGIAGDTAKGMLRYLFEASTESQRYRPPRYRSPSRPRPEPTRPKPKPQSQELPTINSVFRNALKERGVLADWDRMNGRKRGA